MPGSYNPPALNTSPTSTYANEMLSSQRLLNSQEQPVNGLLNQTRPVTLTSHDLLPAYTPVTISELPMLTVYDLTKRSSNITKYKQGRVQNPADLDTEIVPDDKIDTNDLHRVEKEVNKRQKKRLRAIQQNELRAAQQPANQSINRGNGQNQAQDEREIADLELGQGGQEMFVEQLVNNGVQDAANRGMPRVREWSLCGGLMRRHRNGRVDIFCAKELDTDFLYMLMFVTVITGGLTLYACLS